MKKIFKLTHEKTPTPRLVDAIKHEVSKYLKRERRRALPKGADFWDFDCRFGTDADTSQVIHVAEINKHISQAEADNLESFYLEIIARAEARYFEEREQEEEPELSDEELIDELDDLDELDSLETTSEDTLKN